MAIIKVQKNITDKFLIYTLKVKYKNNKMFLKLFNAIL